MSRARSAATWLAFALAGCTGPKSHPAPPQEAGEAQTDAPREAHRQRELDAERALAGELDALRSHNPSFGLHELFAGRLTEATALGRAEADLCVRAAHAEECTLQIARVSSPAPSDWQDFADAGDAPSASCLRRGELLWLRAAAPCAVLIYGSGKLLAP